MYSTHVPRTEQGVLFCILTPIQERARSLGTRLVTIAMTSLYRNEVDSQSRCGPRMDSHVHA